MRARGTGGRDLSHGTTRTYLFVELPEESWRNGGGMTRTIVSSGPPSSDTPPDWRISVADILTDGPFSSFPGVDRTIVLVQGPGLTLTVDGAQHRLALHQPFHFDGGAQTSCAITAPTRDLNVMTRRGAASATVDIVSTGDSAAVHGSASAHLFAVVLQGAVRARDAAAANDWRSPQLGPGDCVGIEGGLLCRFDGDGVLAIITVVAS